MAKFNFYLPTKLTSSQKRAIDSDKAIFLTGVPGSGKTVVSIFRLSKSIKEKKKVMLFIYNRMLSLAIKNSSIQIGITNNNVANIHQWFSNITNGKWLDEYQNDPDKLLLQLQTVNFDEVLFDEGQDLSMGIYEAFKKKTQISISADNAQQLYSVDTTEEKILSLLPSLARYELDENFRNSYEIFNFAKEFVPNNNRVYDEGLLEKLPKGRAEKPYIYINENLNKNIEMIKQILDANLGANIAILVPNILLVYTYYKAIKESYQCSRYHSKLNASDKEETESELQNILVTTFKSAKGMEFDTVIMMGFEQTKEDERNQYFVGATRARTKLFILAIGKLSRMFDNFDSSLFTIKRFDNE